jgi:hypothetical protein
VIDVAYVGSHAVDTPASVNLNAGQTIGAGSAGEPFFAKHGISSTVTQYVQGFSATCNSLHVKFDRALNFIQSYLWEISVGPGKSLLSHGWLGKIVGGWQAAAIP